MSSERKTFIYAVRTTTGQERTVADLVASRAALRKSPIVSILAPEMVRGYIFVESPDAHHVDDIIGGLRHARARSKGIISPAEIERFIVSKPVLEDIHVGDTVEVVSGPFRSLKARITDLDKIKEEVTIQILEEGFASLPVTVRSDYVKLVGRSGSREVEREEAS